MVVVSGAYLALLWLPLTPEKILTFAISIFLLKLLFPKDEKTLGVLKSMHARYLEKIKNLKAKRKKQ